jgi:hypothetical protein
VIQDHEDGAPLRQLGGALIGEGHVRRVVLTVLGHTVLADGCVLGDKGWVPWYRLEAHGSCVN